MILKVTNAKLQKRHFDRLKNQYIIKDILNPPEHTKLEIENLIKLLPVKSGNLIDFGSGTGRLTLQLAQIGYQMTAVDLSINSLNRLKKNANKLNLNVRTTNKFVNEKGLLGIVGSDILHHVDLEEKILEMYKILPKNGFILFSEPCALNPSWYIYFLIRGDWRYEKGILNCTKWNLYRILKESGFKKIEIIGLGFFPRVLFQNKYLCKINDLLGSIFPFNLFAYRYLIKAVK